jgi:hypothetical protein
MNNRAILKSIKKIIKEVNKIQRAVEPATSKKDKFIVPKKSYVECNDEYIRKIIRQGGL